MEILRLVVILLLIILLIVVGSKVIYKDNFATITGSVTVKKSNDPGNFYEVTRIENIEYPNGFNKDNCTVIAFGCNRTTNSNKYYGIDYNVANPVSAMVTGDIPREVNLSDKIILNFFSYSGSDITVRYEVVLMKIK